MVKLNYFSPLLINFVITLISTMEELVIGMSMSGTHRIATATAATFIHRVERRTSGALGDCHYAI